ncbi:hypothetical protein EV363DRAFT_1166818 [Boletus edulis]|nr:hypothetical protein EV363DRAFT_1166818 [Boletus edulis]
MWIGCLQERCCFPNVLASTQSQERIVVKTHQVKGRKKRIAFLLLKVFCFAVFDSIVASDQFCLVFYFFFCFAFRFNG